MFKFNFSQIRLLISWQSLTAETIFRVIQRKTFQGGCRCRLRDKVNNYSMTEYFYSTINIIFSLYGPRTNCLGVRPKSFLILSDVFAPLLLSSHTKYEIMKKDHIAEEHLWRNG